MSDEQTTSELVEQFNKGQNHALRIVADLLGTSMPTHQNVASKIKALQARVDALEGEVRQTSSSNLSVRTKSLTETAKILSKRNDNIR